MTFVNSEPSNADTDWELWAKATQSAADFRSETDLQPDGEDTDHTLYLKLAEIVTNWSNA